MLAKVRVIVLLLLILFMMGVFSLGSVTVSAALTPDFDQLNQLQIVEAMGAGWNLGNQLDANINGTPSETAWGNPVITRELIQKVKAAGFKTIRIPVSYLNKIGSAPDYTIDGAWLARIKEVVDYVYDEGLFVIINIHHDGHHSVTGAWLLVDSPNQTEIRQKFQKVWLQVANTFKDYDERLIFESMNEIFDGDYGPPNPSYYQNLNAYNQIFVDTVRQTGGNNSARWLLVPGWNTNIDYTAGDYGFVIPSDNYRSSAIPALEKRIMISAHYYSPWDFCGEETGAITQWGEIATDPYRKSTWGQEDYMYEQIRMMYSKFVIEGYPVVLGEWGAIDKTSADPTNNIYRAYFAKTFCMYSRLYHAVPVYWDNGWNGVYGFGLFDRVNLTVTQQGIIDAIMEGMGGEVFPTPTPYLTPTPTPTRPPTTPTPTPTKGPTPTPTPTMPYTPGQVRVEAGCEESNPNVQSLIRMTVWNEGSAALNNLSVRYFVNLSELYAAGYSAGDVTLDVYYSSTGVTVSPLTTYDAANRIYYFELNWGSYSLAPGGRIDANFSIHLTGWQPAWNPANDWSYQGLSGSYTNTPYIPVYRGTAGLIYGLEPGDSPPPTPTPTKPGPTPTPTPTKPGPTPTPTPTTPTPTPTPTLSPTPTPTPGPGDGYVVVYDSNDWGGGATIYVTIINNTSSAVNGWVLAWNFPGNQQITELWCGDHTQTGVSVSVRNLDWNAQIPANGGSVTFGFNIVYSGVNNKPSAFTLNGVSCRVQ